MTNNLLLFLRNIGRITGLNSLVGRVFDNGYYEKKFSESLLSNIREDDVVWDVGANVGLYTELFLDKIGNNGLIFAFEPSPGSIKCLENLFKDANNVYIANLALGEFPGSANMLFGSDPTSVTNRIVEISSTVENVQKVSIMSGDILVKKEGYKIPNVIKIDVEGHELSVVKGMLNILTNTSVRCIGIEVHFSLLMDRGEGQAPKEIEKILSQNNFQITWTDPSHIVASR